MQFTRLELARNAPLGPRPGHNEMLLFSEKFSDIASYVKHFSSSFQELQHAMSLKYIVVIYVAQGVLDNCF